MYSLLLCYYDNKASDVVKTIHFLKCYKTNNMRLFPFKLGTFFMFDTCKVKMLTLFYYM